MTVRARGAGTVCGESCASLCGDGDEFELFVSEDGTSWTHMGRQTTGSSLADVTVDVPVVARRVRVCRTGAGGGKDHVEVDYVAVQGCR